MKNVQIIPLLLLLALYPGVVFAEGGAVISNSPAKTLILNGLDEYVALDTPGPDNFEAGPELITNGSFEDYSGALDDGADDSFQGWTVNTSGGGKVEAVADAYDGPVGVKLSNGNPGSAVIHQTIPVTPGAFYGMFFSTKRSSVENASLRFAIIDETHKTAVKPLRTTIRVSSYNLFRETFQAPEGCTMVRIEFRTSAYSEGVVYLDDVRLRRIYDMSFMFWIKRTLPDINVSRQYVMGRLEGSTNRNWYFSFAGTGEGLAPENIGKLRLGVRWGNPGTAPASCTTRTVLRPCLWYFVAATYKVSADRAGFELKIYVNGELETTVPRANGPIFFGNPPWRVGATSVVGSPHFFQGEIGELQIVRNKLLSASEIRDAYQNGIPAAWPPGIILAHYDWRGTDDAEFLRDISGQGNDLGAVNVTRSGNQGSAYGQGDCGLPRWVQQLLAE